jgi:hypothetical protein
VFRDHPDEETAKSLAEIRPASATERGADEIAMVFGCAYKPEQIENAYLISAAPDLFEVVRLLDKHGVASPMLMSMAAKAIAKARGEPT